MIRVLLIGTGGWGKTWCRKTLTTGVKEGWITVVGAADKDEKQLVNAREWLHLSEEQVFTDSEEAIRRLKPDACVISAAPQAHEELILLALSYHIPVLCEKPITDSVESIRRIYKKANRSNIPFAITFSHRFTKPIQALHKEISSGAYGKLDYLVMNFTCKEENSFSPRKFTAPELMTNEYNIHHLEFLLYLAGSPCEWIFTDKWNPPHAPLLLGGSQGMTIIKCKNGVRISLESNIAAANSLHGWENDFIRAELEKAELLLDGDQLYCYWKDKEAPVNHSCEPELLPMEEDRTYWGNEWLLEQFVNWVEGGKPMETRFENAFWPQLMVFASAKSAESGEKVYLDSFAEDSIFTGP